MPFSDLKGITQDEWTEVYEQLFKPAIEDSNLGYICERSEIRNGAFTKDIIQNLKSAKVVLADLTHFNANVMWELGVRHTLSKRTILVARHDVMQEKIISDMKIYGVIPYNTQNLTQVNEFKTKIRTILKQIENDPERSDSPVFDFLTEEELIRSSTDRTKILNNLAGLLSELLYDLDFTQKVETKELNTNMESTTLNRMMSEAIDYFLNTNYITTDESLLKLMRDVQEDVASTNKRLDLVLLDKRLKTDFGHPKAIFDKCVNLQPKLKKAITKINELRNTLKIGTFEISEAPILVSTEKQKELL